MQYKNISASTQIKTGTGVVTGVIVNSHSSGTVRLNDGTSGTTSAGVVASQTLTTTDVFTAGETITLGDVTYTIVDALSGAKNEVLKGASAAATLDNLKAAVNASAGAGTTYGVGTVANPTVIATTNADDSQIFTAYTVGVAGNAIVSVTDAAAATFGAETFESGAEASTLITNTFTFPSGSGVYDFPEISFVRGLYATIGGTADITILYQ